MADVRFKHENPRRAWSWLALGAVGFLALGAVAQEPAVVTETQQLGRGGRPFGAYGEAVAVDGPLILIGDGGGEGPGSVRPFVLLPDGTWRPGDAFTVEKLGDYDYDGEFGSSVDLVGQRALIGRPGEGQYQGAAYFFEMGSDGDWVQEERLPTPPPGSFGYDYGLEVAYNGRTAAMTGWDCPDDAPEEECGVSVLLFERDNGTWVLVYRRFLPTGHWPALAIDGDTLLIGDPYHEHMGTRSGGVHVLKRNGHGQWHDTATLVPGSIEPDAGFGSSAALDGDRAVIGAPGLRYYPGAGVAYVYARDGRGRWHEETKLTADDEVAYWDFGAAAALSGDTAVVGRTEWGDNALGVTYGKGSAYVFERRNSGEWVQRAKLMASDGEAGAAFGGALSIDGQWLVVGAPSMWAFDLWNYFGAAYVFDLRRIPMTVKIDVQPWSADNLVDPRSTRLVAVALHGSPEFDALQCDLKAIRLAPGNALSRSYRATDADHDGYMDLLVYFRSRDLRIGCGSTLVQLTGRTHEGSEMLGTDTVRNRRCP